MNCTRCGTPRDEWRTACAACLRPYSYVPPKPKPLVEPAPLNAVPVKKKKATKKKK